MPHYTLMDANNGERHVILEGWQVKAVLVDADHAELGREIVELLNAKRERDGGEKEQCVS